MRISKAEERSSQNSMRSLFRFFQQRLEHWDRAFWPMQNHFQTSAQQMSQFLFRDAFGLRLIEQPFGIPGVRFVEK